MKLFLVSTSCSQINKQIPSFFKSVLFCFSGFGNTNVTCKSFFFFSLAHYLEIFLGVAGKKRKCVQPYERVKNSYVWLTHERRCEYVVPTTERNFPGIKLNQYITRGKHFQLLINSFIYLFIRGKSSVQHNNNINKVYWIDNWLIYLHMIAVSGHSFENPRESHCLRFSGRVGSFSKDDGNSNENVKKKKKL